MSNVNVGPLSGQPAIFYHVPAEHMNITGGTVEFVCRGKSNCKIDLRRNTYNALQNNDWPTVEIDASDDRESPTRLYFHPRAEVCGRLFVSQQWYRKTFNVLPQPRTSLYITFRDDPTRLYNTWVYDYEWTEALYVRNGGIVRYQGYHAEKIPNAGNVRVYHGGTTDQSGLKSKMPSNPGPPPPIDLPFDPNAQHFLPRSSSLTKIGSPGQGALFIESSYAAGVGLEIVKFPVGY